jgi:DDE family transposase
VFGAHPQRLAGCAFLLMPPREGGLRSSRWWKPAPTSGREAFLGLRCRSTGPFLVLGLHLLNQGRSRVSSYAKTPASTYRLRPVLTSFLQHDGLPFAEVLSAQDIQEAFAAEGAAFAADQDAAVYTPEVTLWAFLSQVLFKDEQRSCLAAVARVLVLLVGLCRPPCAKNSGAYCRARAKIPTRVLRRLATVTAAGAEQRLPSKWLWRGRHVQLVDGFTVSMPDTPANQKEYPQPNTQKPGVGFPLARCVVLLSLASGMAADLEIGPYAGKETGETALLRALLHRLHDGDIVLADRHYCSYFMIALLRALGVDFVVRLHQCRTADFRRGRRLGPRDHLVTWQRPEQPDWMDDATYAAMPATITVREIEVQVNQPGFRTDSFVVVTTLHDVEEYTLEDVSELYRKRWLAELDIRGIKSTLGFDILRCRTPEMVRKELWTALLAYNLIRQTMLQAAAAADCSPRELSFAHALQTMGASWGVVVLLSAEAQVVLIDASLAGLAGQRIGARPDRVEPRKIKRRPKPHKLLTKPRAEERAELLQGAERDY